MSTLAAIALIGAVVPAPALGQTRAVPLPDGETPLGDIGIYSVFYQSYDGEVVPMPQSWTGHFEATSGISYVPHERVLGRDAMLLHSPWRVPAGRAWVDYYLQLPDTTPIKLSFGIAMRPDMAAPDRSDGVTFSCHLTAEGEERELMRAHQDRAEWSDHQFDLSEFAGEEVLLRLQTEPGPANSASWDYSYFGDARIAVGAETQSRQELLRTLTSSLTYAMYRHRGDLTKLSNDPERGVVPSAFVPEGGGVGGVGGGYDFRCRGLGGPVTYRYTPDTGTLDDFTAQFRDGTPFKPALGGGVTIAGPDGDSAPSVRASGGRAHSIEFEDTANAIKVAWDYDVGDRSLRVDWRFGADGNALTVEASCEEPILTGLSLGHVGDAPLRRTIGVPYLLGSLDYLPLENLFVCRYLDWTRSNASACPQGEASYHTKTDGTRNPLTESGYVAVSSYVQEVLPNIPNPPSPYLDLLGPRIMLDIWEHHRGTYAGDAENLRALKDNGVDHLAIISHAWQRYGYDVKLPDHLPANPAFGGDEGMIEFGKAANECGYVWSLHENYIDLYPDAPSYDETAAVLRADGSFSPAWFNRGTGVQSFGLKCNRALEYAKQNAPEIHRRFGTNAAYLDVHTCVPPWHQLDHDADQPMAAMARSKVEHDSELFRFMRDTHEGPLFGEGANHFYWAGKVDGTEAQVAGGENHTPFLDFDLLKLHPQMVNHGMGYYERWFEQGYGMGFGFDVGTVEDVDKYRAQEMAYGHAGFIGNVSTDNMQWVAKEHHMMHPVQRLHGTAKATEISYEIDGQLLSASVALAMNERSRQQITYDSGLTVWVNWSEEPWTVRGRTLLQWGTLALGPQTEVWTALQDGTLADYAACPEFVFVDARTYFHMPYRQRGVDVEPCLAKFEYLGENKIRVAYEWVVNDTLDDDYHCFVHFTSGASQTGDEIVFQQDHAPPTPTSQWQPGQTITDGPYEIEVPGDKFDTYDLVIGLHKGPRVPLRGLDAGGARILIGRLLLERDGDRITDTTLADLNAEREAYQSTRADFGVNLNPEGTRVDFGTIATDGSVKVNRGEDGLVVFPYPRDKEFTVALDLKALAGRSVDAGGAKVTALAALTLEDLGDVPTEVTDGRLVFSVGLEGAGRYRVAW